MPLDLTRHILEEPCRSPHFSGSWQLQDLEICDGLIDYFEHHQGQQRPGVAGSGYLRLDVKDSVDMSIKPLQILMIRAKCFKGISRPYSCVTATIISNSPFLRACSIVWILARLIYSAICLDSISERFILRELVFLLFTVCLLL